MRELKDIIKDIRNTEQTAAIKEEEIPYKSRGGMLIAVRQAQEALPKLIDELKACVIPGKLTAVYATGAFQVLNDVATVMLGLDQETPDPKGVVLDANIMYKTIASRVETTFGDSKNRTFSTTQYSSMIQGIREVAQGLGYMELPSPPYKETICPDYKTVLAHVRDCIRTSIGDNLNLRYLTNKIVESVLKLKNAPKAIPILVLDVKSEEEKKLLNTLFSSNIDYNFPNNFTADPKSIVKIFKNSTKVADEGAEKE